MKLATKHLILRPFTPDDFAAIHEYSSKETVCKFMEWGPNTKEDTKKFLDSVLLSYTYNPRSSYDFIITLKDGTVVGACGLYFNQTLTIPSVGYVLNDIYWGKGYATEATKALLAFAFNTLKVGVVNATCDEDNIASSKVLAKAGLRFVEKIVTERKGEKVIVKKFSLTSLEYKLNNHKTII